MIVQNLKHTSMRTTNYNLPNGKENTPYLGVIITFPYDISTLSFKLTIKGCLTLIEGRGIMKNGNSIEIMKGWMITIKNGTYPYDLLVSEFGKPKDRPISGTITIEETIG